MAKSFHHQHHHLIPTHIKRDNSTRTDYSSLTQSVNGVKGHEVALTITQ